ncbi:hypothetical protein Gotri_012574 [Gossypium trilobum]|uniref:Uncharacterized protein n=1 Tax=Gossypium trilobum TaxID=34281 RepID=A0A7J9DQP0_9ROSI|nr:hypothetical protein [Gossypium trilobum]
MPLRAPKRSRTQSKPVLSLGYNEDKFESEEVEKYFQSIQSRSFIYERGFDLATPDYHEIWNLVCQHQWNQFAILPTTPVVIPIFLLESDDKDTKEEANGEGNNEEEGDDDEATEDDDATPYCDNFEDLFLSAQPSTKGPIIRESTEQSKLPYKKSIVEGK